MRDPQEERCGMNSWSSATGAPAKPGGEGASWISPPAGPRPRRLPGRLHPLVDPGIGPGGNRGRELLPRWGAVFQRGGEPGGRRGVHPLQPPRKEPQKQRRRSAARLRWLPWSREFESRAFRGTNPALCGAGRGGGRVAWMRESAVAIFAREFRERESRRFRLLCRRFFALSSCAERGSLRRRGEGGPPGGGVPFPKRGGWFAQRGLGLGPPPRFGGAPGRAGGEGRGGKGSRPSATSTRRSVALTSVGTTTGRRSGASQLRAGGGDCV